MSHVTDEKLRLWIENNWNVLFVGLHGVGKTAIVKKIFTECFGVQGEDWLYFSASTMDPWVDFIGVPKEVMDDKTGEAYLKLIRPLAIQKGKVKAMFFDELNRSHKKVRNAVMELIQFKSINGLGMPGLRCVWGAINPDDHDKVDYDVETLDPAQKDRFHIFVDVPYKPSIPFLKDKYGEEMAMAAVDWWNKLPEDTKLKVTPRRLDYALEIFNANGDIRDVLDRTAGVPALIDGLMHGSPVRVFDRLIKEIEKGVSDATGKLKEFLKKDTNYRAVEEKIIKQAKARSICIPLIPQEQIVTLVSEHRSVKEEVFTTNPSLYRDIISHIAHNAQNKTLKNEAKKALMDLKMGEAGSAERLDAVDLPLRECKIPVWSKEHIKTNFEFNDACPQFAKTKDFDEASFEKEVLRIQQLCIFAENDYNRKKYMSQIAPLMSDQMSVAQAKTMLKFVEWFVGSVSYKKLDTFADINKIINTPIMVLVKNDPLFTPEDLFKAAPHVVGKYLYSKLLKSDIKDWAIKLKEGATMLKPAATEETVDDAEPAVV